MAFGYYDILGVNQHASQEEIRNAYYAKARQFHPDRNLGNEEAAAEQFKKVGEAYETLSDPVRKRIYDDTRDGINFQNFIPNFRPSDNKTSIWQLLLASLKVYLAWLGTSFVTLDSKLKKNNLSDFPFKLSKAFSFDFDLFKLLNPLRWGYFLFRLGYSLEESVKADI